MGCDNICGTNISTSKAKSVVLNRRDPVRSKMVIYNYIIEQIKSFSFLSCSISYMNKKYISVRVSEFL